jgi:hypothetical protein
VTTKKSEYQQVLFPTLDQIPPSANRTWYNKISDNLFWPYLEDLRYCICPVHSERQTFSDPDLLEGGNWWKQWTGYMVPSDHFSNTNYYSGEIHTNKRKLSQRSHPSKLFLYFDADTITFGQAYKSNWDTTYQKVNWQHNCASGFNAHYFDGHVAFIPLKHIPLDQYSAPYELDNWK